MIGKGFQGKVLVFDMDGTIVDLYGVRNWLPQLRCESVLPYVVAKPLVDMKRLNDILSQLKEFGWRVAVVTWGSKGATSEYNARISTAKKEWLDKYKFPYDDFYFLSYGVDKNKPASIYEGWLKILIDDDDRVREQWSGQAVNPQDINMILSFETVLAMEQWG
jgi:phosphoglycolate phosphatase-like HAD superfamily hydrolase